MLKTLAGNLDFYRCLHIKLNVLPENFSQCLENSLIQWHEEKIKAV